MPDLDRFVLGESLKTARERDDLYDALALMLPLFKGFVSDVGGCDHSVGICCCEDYRIIDIAENAIKNAHRSKK